MNRERLKKTLIDEQFNDRTYSLEAGKFDPDEALCLRQEENRWSVYYSERGLQTGKIVFGSEEEACGYFLDQMRSDPTTRKEWKSGWQMSHRKRDNA